VEQPLERKKERYMFHQKGDMLKRPERVRSRETTIDLRGGASLFLGREVSFKLRGRFSELNVRTSQYIKALREL
jgi:hypothetical protein